MILEKDYKECLKYIENYWPKITFYFPKDKGLQVGLPNKFVSPNRILFKYDQFYWDTYFTILGLTVSGKIELAKGMVDNLIFLYKKFGIIPMRNRFYNLGISQPPFLTSMILEIFNFTKDKNWLLSSVQVAEDELKNYWMNKNHNLFSGLSRYHDHFWINSTAEHESGWDMTSRFSERCLDYLPVDLNSLLYKYETDIAEIYRTLGNKKKSKEYFVKSEKRKMQIVKFMWNEKRGFFFDYDFRKEKQSDFYSLAGFYPLFAKVATKEQAKKMVLCIKDFEYKGGLANTQKENLSQDFKQWDYPNGWANQQYIVIKGLLNYGYNKEAEGLAKKWLDFNKDMFIKTGKFWEKYNVAEYSAGKLERYPVQTGFGWTNAVFARLVNEFATELIQ